MTRLTPAQVQEIEDYWQCGSEFLTNHEEHCWKAVELCAIARLIASHREVERIVEDNAQCCEERRKVEAETTRLRKALKLIKDMDQDELRAAMVDGDTLRILGSMARLFNRCRDIAQQALTGQEAQDENL